MEQQMLARYSEKFQNCGMDEDYILIQYLFVTYLFRKIGLSVPQLPDISLTDGLTYSEKYRVKRILKQSYGEWLLWMGGFMDKVKWSISEDDTKTGNVVEVTFGEAINAMPADIQGICEEFLFDYISFIGIDADMEAYITYVPLEPDVMQSLNHAGSTSKIKKVACRLKNTEGFFVGAVDMRYFCSSEQKYGLFYLTFEPGGYEMLDVSMAVDYLKAAGKI